MLGISLDKVANKLLSNIDTWDHFTHFMARLTPDLPQHAWWLPLIILIILGATAIVDAYKAQVPDIPLFVGVLIVFAAFGLFRNWTSAAEHLGYGFLAALALWGGNELFYRWQGKEAIGMGDAKWTALAVATFGFKPAIIAWIVGAWLGIFWLAVAWILSFTLRLLLIESNLKIKQIHFAPFLFAGLLAGLYWYHVR